jgi:DNA-binding MarR family transcriptional regulator
MHLHGIVKIDADASSAVQSANSDRTTRTQHEPELKISTMKRKPSTEATAAWIRLMRVQSRVLDAVEQDLKKAGFPPLAWYDALLELSRSPSGELRPVELERQMLIPQYSTSRLIDRLVDEGLAARRECKVDKRGQFVEITEAGRELQKRMWGAYSAAIETYVGSKLSDTDAAKLCGLLDRLGCSCGEMAPPVGADGAPTR